MNTRPTPALFAPLTLGPMTVPNRIAVAPMCQYSADDGSATDWHMQHWMSLAMSGAGMVTIEATGVERHGRITHGCLGLYSDHNEDAAKRTLTAARRVAPHGTRFGVQIAHAGRKASVHIPWKGGKPLGADEDAWQAVGPSAVPYAPDWPAPRALDDDGIQRVISHFVLAAERAVRAGFDFIEIHGAHGYLIHSFLSPVANKRTDHWGGSLENRMRLVLAIAGGVRAAVPDHIAVGIRLSVTDWVKDGFNPDEAVVVARALKEAGLVYVCCSSGGVAHNQKLTPGPGYQVHLAERVRSEAGIPTRAVGLIDDPHQAEEIIAGGRADMVALARALLADPRWPWRAAAALGQPVHPVSQYATAAATIARWAQPVA